MPPEDWAMPTGIIILYSYSGGRIITTNLSPLLYSALFCWYTLCTNHRTGQLSGLCGPDLTAIDDYHLFFSGCRMPFKCFPTCLSIFHFVPALLALQLRILFVQLVQYMYRLWPFPPPPQDTWIMQSQIYTGKSAATGHRCPVTGTKLYCWVTEEHVYENLPKIATRQRNTESQSHTINNYITRPYFLNRPPIKITRLG